MKPDDYNNNINLHMQTNYHEIQRHEDKMNMTLKSFAYSLSKHS